MVTIGKFRRTARVATVVGAAGAAALLAAGPAFAANDINIKGVGPSNVAVSYTCDAGSGGTALGVMVGAPQADAPSAQGQQNGVTCDGSPQSAVVVLQGAPLTKGQRVQVRVAVVNAAGDVVVGRNGVFTLG